MTVKGVFDAIQLVILNQFVVTLRIIHQQSRQPCPVQIILSLHIHHSLISIRSNGQRCLVSIVLMKQRGYPCPFRPWLLGYLLVVRFQESVRTIVYYYRIEEFLGHLQNFRWQQMILYP